MATKKTTKKGTPSRKNVSNSSKKAKVTKKKAKTTKKAAKVAKVVRFSTKDREKQKKFVWQTVAGRKERATFEHIAGKLQKKYPAFKEHSVRYLIDNLVAEDHLRPVRVAGQRALRYAIGKSPL